MAKTAAELKAEVEAWLVRRNFPDTQCADVLNNVDSLHDLTAAADEDIAELVAEGLDSAVWSTLAKKRFTRCVSKLRSGGEPPAPPVPAPPVPAPPAAAPLLPRGAEVTPPRDQSPDARPQSTTHAAPDTSGDAALARRLGAAASPRRREKKQRPAAARAPKGAKKQKRARPPPPPPPEPVGASTDGDAELARRVALGLRGSTAGSSISPAGWDAPAWAAPASRPRPRPRGGASKNREDTINRRVRAMLWHKPAARLDFLSPNPKKPASSSSGAKSAARYDTYLGATTVAAFHASRGTVRDLVYDICRGWCTVHDVLWAHLAAAEAAPAAYVYDAASGVTRAPGAPPTPLMLSGGRRAPTKVPPDARRALAAERWAARYDEVLWVKEAAGGWWPGRVMAPDGVAEPVAGRARREHLKRYVVLNFGVEESERFSFVEPAQLMRWAAGLAKGYDTLRPAQQRYAALRPGAVAAAEYYRSEQEDADAEDAAPLPMPWLHRDGAPEEDEVDDFVITARAGPGAAAAPAPAPAVAAPRPPAVNVPRPPAVKVPRPAPAPAARRPRSPRASDVDAVIERDARIERTAKPRPNHTRDAALEVAATARAYLQRGTRSDLRCDLMNDYFRVVDVPQGCGDAPAGAVFDREARGESGTWWPPSRSGGRCVVLWCRWLPAFQLRDGAGVTTGAWQVQWKQGGSRTVSHVAAGDVRVFRGGAAPAARPDHALLVGAALAAPVPAPPPAHTAAPAPADSDTDDGDLRVAPGTRPAPAPAPLPPFDPLETAPAATPSPPAPSPPPAPDAGDFTVALGMRPPTDDALATVEAERERLAKRIRVLEARAPPAASPVPPPPPPEPPRADDLTVMF